MVVTRVRIEPQRLPIGPRAVVPGSPPSPPNGVLARIPHRNAWTSVVPSINLKHLLNLRRRMDRREMKHAFVSTISNRLFRWIWFMTFLVFIIDGTYLLGMTRLYQWIVYTPWVITEADWYLHLVSVSIMKVVIWIFLVLALQHLLLAMRMVYWSIKHWELTLHHRVTTRPADGKPFHELSSSKLAMWLELMILYDKWIDPFTAIESEHYDAWVNLQEIVQIASETYQCYSLSHLVATKWINQLAVTICFLNCVTTPLIHLLFPDELPLQRYLCVLCDCWIGLIQAVVIPLIIVYPYQQTFDPSVQGFPSDLFYDDIWFAEAVHQLEQILIVSLVDLAATILPHLTFATSLHRAKALVQRRRSQFSDENEQAGPSRFRSATNSKVASIHVSPVTSPCLPNGRLGSSRASMDPQDTIHSQPKPLYKRLRHFDYLTILYGICIVICHRFYQTENADAHRNCKSHPNPWFARKYACAVVYINCYRRNITGRSHEIGAILDEMEANAVSSFILGHCSELEIPAALQTMSNIFGIEVFNSTIVQWNHSAAIDARYHHTFKYLCLEFTNLSGLPEGILADHVPGSFVDFEIVYTNLTSLPTNVHEVLPQLEVLYLEYNHMTRIPDTVRFLRHLNDFSIVGQQVQVIDEDFFQMGIMGLTISNNSIENLPASISDLKALNWFVLEYTNVREIPVDIMHQFLELDARGEYFVHSAFGTPFCLSKHSSSGSQEEKLEDAIVQAYKALACAEDIGTASGIYPLQYVLPQRVL